jgi:hypothetical protein
MVLANQLTVILHAGSRDTWHSFLNFCLHFSKLSRPGTCLLRAESVIFSLQAWLGGLYTAASRTSLLPIVCRLLWLLLKQREAGLHDYGGITFLTTTGVLLFLPGTVSPIKVIIWNNECLVMFQICFWQQANILQLITELIVLPPNAMCIKCYDSEWPMNFRSHFVSLN